jgi:hypothetical protein
VSDGKIMRIPFSNLKFENWENLFIPLVLSLYLILFGSWVAKGNYFGVDYFAFWSTGKIADGKGYSEIYDLNNLRIVQTQELNALGLLEKTDNLSYSPIPAPIFSFFVPLFQLFSKIDLESGYWIWTILNLVILIGYLVFFLRRIQPESCSKIPGLKSLIIVLASYPVFFNMEVGQIEVFLLVCAGEFIRYSVYKKPVLSGLWLGGLLLKPQLLIIIIPIILLMRYWKVLTGFIISSGVILITSLSLSGFTGLKSLINLWTRYSVGIATNNPEIMINWRMVGAILNNYLNTSIGWVITGLGIFLTILAVGFIIKKSPPYGSSKWVMNMLGVFSATLAITWHAHYHMAMVIIPFLVYASISKNLPEKTLFIWMIVTPAAVVLFGIIYLLVLNSMKTDIHNAGLIVVALSGFIVNLALLVFSIQSSRVITEISKKAV